MSCACDCVLECWRCWMRRGYENLDEEATRSRTVSSDTITIGREGCTFSRREESGYALRIPEGAVQNEFDVTVEVLLPNSEAYSTPEGRELVSGVCHVVSRKEIELEESGYLVIDHCINIRSAEDRDSLSVVTRDGRRRRGSGNDQFQYVDSDIVVRSDSVVVTLKKLGPAYYAVVCSEERRDAVEYCGLLYRELYPNQFSLGCLKFFFVVVKDIKPCVKVVEDECKGRNLARVYEPIPVTFAQVPDGEERKLQLVLDKPREDEWQILPLTSEILECDAHNYDPTTRATLPSLEVHAQFRGFMTESSPQRFFKIIKIKGTVRPESLTLLYVAGSPYPQETTGANNPMVPSMMKLIKCVGQKTKHNIPEEIGTDYGNFGILLLNDETGERVRAIEWQYRSHSESINREILRQWLKGEGKKPVQWATLIEVLRDISKNTLAEDIEHGLKERSVI